MRLSVRADPEPELIRLGGLRPLAKRRASGHGPVVLSGAQLFALREPDAISFGLAVHKVFEQIEWAGKEALAKLESLREKMPAEAVDEVEQCLVNEAMAKRLAKPNSDVELWRERPFDVVLGDELISGVFDRVHLFADAYRLQNRKGRRGSRRPASSAIAAIPFRISQANRLGRVSD